MRGLSDCALGPALALVLAVTGCEESQPTRDGWGSVAGAGSAGAPAVPLVDIRGDWGMFTADTDQIVARFSRERDPLSGFGCFAGFPGPNSLEGYEQEGCGALQETSRTENELSFRFDTTLFGSYSYLNRLFVAADGSRMSGSVRYESPSTSSPSGSTRTVWLPILGGEAWLPGRLDWPDGITWTSSSLTLENASGDELVGSQSYRLSRYRDALVGDLGAFWTSELHFEQDAGGGQILIAGPVHETEPHQATELRLRFEGGELTQVDAKAATANYTFSASAPTQP